MQISPLQSMERALIQHDSKGQPFIEWHQGNGHIKRAWIQRRGGENDWAGTERYLNVGRRGEDGKSGGCPVDFPVRGNRTDEAVLLAFAKAAAEVEG